MSIARVTARASRTLVATTRVTGFVRPVRNSTFWAHVEEAPLDGNHATAHAFDTDPSPLKVNLGRGIYKDDSGKNWVLPSVKKAEAVIASQPANHDYLNFKGLPEFVKATAEFAFQPDHPLLKAGQIATIQTLSGTGALRVGAEFLQRNRPSSAPAEVYLPNPTYVNHYPIFRLTGHSLKTYRYYDPANNALDLQGMLEDLEKAAPGAVVLLHACAHNPTGIDPTQEQWKRICDVVKRRKLLAFFDLAYQGFASGDPDRDAYSLRLFVQEGVDVLAAQSYAKNMGLYGQRVGALNVITRSKKECSAVTSQLNQVVRPMYSNPPAYGARIVSTIFTTPDLRKQWQVDVKTMADRIIGVRRQLVQELEKLGSKRSWKHISAQIGMFAYSGLKEAEVQELRKHHVYLNLDGRMSMTGVNSGNVQYLANAIHTVTK
jgi:aspartate aminotransferase